MSRAWRLSGDARIAERADEDRVELVPQHVVAVGRNRDAGLQEVVRAPGQHFEIERAAEDLGRRARSTFTASAVTSTPMPSPGMTAMRLAAGEAIDDLSDYRLRAVSSAVSICARCSRPLKST